MSSTHTAGTTIRRKYLALAYGVLCHGLFALAVSVMIYEMYFGLSRSRGALHAPWSWIGNVLLLLQFPLAHSFLLTGRGRAVLRGMAPAALGSDLSTTSYVIVASLQILLLFGWWSPSGTIWWQAEGPMLSVMTFLYTAGWLLLLKSMFDAGIALQIGALGWWAVFRNARPVYPPMPTRGLFRICRQPIYLSFAITLWTVPVWTPDQLVLAIVLSAYCLAGPLLKEERFARLFGSEFEAYRARHPYWLPFPRAARRPSAHSNPSLYDRDAEHWWDGSQRWLRALQNLVPARFAFFDRLTSWNGQTVLDLGCGGGFMSEALAARGASVIGVDVSRAAVAAARRHAASRGLPIRYLVGSGEDLPLPGGSVDCVVCVDVLEHVRSLDQVLDEIRRVLRPGGIFLFDTINRTPLARFVIVVCGERILRLLPRGTHDPAGFISLAELDAKLAARGFADRVFEGLGPRGLDRHLDITFGPLPGKQIMYMGHARLIRA
ncbi:MAG TPA: bifunctional 2-polyprenyl-6-hydroxyphenol methylase/3-demethylubiquinol 3-O-methyltransferase UbiG [Pseudolabrys sp.]